MLSQFSQDLNRFIQTKISTFGNTTLWLIFLFLFSYFLLFAYTSITLNYLPTFSDEYGYLLNAKSFQLNNRIDTIITINEIYSKVGDSSFHGFMYSILYGIFFKLFALLNINTSMIYVNIIFSFFFIFFIFLMKIFLKKKLFISILFLSNFITIIYSFNFMVESFHLMNTSIVAYILFNFYKHKKTKYLVIFVCYTFFLSLFRQSWIFFLFALLPLVTSKRDLIKYSLIIISGFIFIIMDMIFFHAPYPFAFIHNFMHSFSVNTLFENIIILWNHFSHNIKSYFISTTYEAQRFVFYSKYLFVFSLITLIYYGLKDKDKIFYSVSLVSLIYFISLLLFYDTSGWREVRSLAAIFIIINIFLILKNKFIPVALVIMLQLVVFPEVLSFKETLDSKREELNYTIAKEKERINNFTMIEKIVIDNPKDKILVLLKKNLIKINNSPILFKVPTISATKQYIQYSFLFGNFDINNSDADFYISNNFEELLLFQLIHKNKDFYFYKRITNDTIQQALPSRQ